MNTTHHTTQDTNLELEPINPVCKLFLDEHLSSFSQASTTILNSNPNPWIFLHHPQIREKCFFRKFSGIHALCLEHFDFEVVYTFIYVCVWLLFGLNGEQHYLSFRFEFYFYLLRLNSVMKARTFLIFYFFFVWMY